MDFIPRWHLFNIVFSRGRRLPKFERLLPECKTSRSRDARTSGFNAISPRVLAVAKDKLFSFDNEEYRFWAIDMGENTMSKDPTPHGAICRFCGTIAYTKQSRRAHMENMQCTTKLIVCYESLLKDQKCIACDNKTTERKWGVPLHHDEVCMDYWMFDEPCPEGLAAAVNLYKRTRAAQ